MTIVAAPATRLSIKENGDPQDDMEQHLSFLKRTLGGYLVQKYDLHCRGGAVVFADRTLMKVQRAIVMSDNEGDTPEQRRLVVNMIKMEMGRRESHDGSSALTRRSELTSGVGTHTVLPGTDAHYYAQLAVI